MQYRTLLTPAIAGLFFSCAGAVLAQTPAQHHAPSAGQTDRFGRVVHGSTCAQDPANCAYDPTQPSQQLGAAPRDAMPTSTPSDMGAAPSPAVNAPSDAPAPYPPRETNMPHLPGGY